VPVVAPDVELTADVDASLVAGRIRHQLSLLGADIGRGPVALAFRWRGDPSYQRLRALAEGIRAAAGGPADSAAPPVVVLLDGDVGRGLGRILREELGADRFICLDGLPAAEFDYVDVGRITEPAGAVPVVVKALLFGR
jgi:ethanolamine utilization protein EutA